MSLGGVTDPVEHLADFLLYVMPGFVALQWPRLEKTIDFYLGFEASRRGKIKTIKTEADGRHDIVLGDGSVFRLTARADRIELNTDGSVTLVDYKTGTPPGNGEIFVGFAPQAAADKSPQRFVDRRIIAGVDRVERLYDFLVNSFQHLRGVDGVVDQFFADVLKGSLDGNGLGRVLANRVQRPNHTGDHASHRLGGFRLLVNGQLRGIVRRVLETDQFPSVEFSPTSIKGLPKILPTSGAHTFDVSGNLTVKGVTKPTLWHVTAESKNGQIAGTASTLFTFADFNIDQPHVPIVLSVNDTIRLEYDFALVPKG